MPRRTLLFICTGNAGRSQIAQALAEPIVPADVNVVSAGVDPWPDLHPVARRLLVERGIDLTGRRPKHVNTFARARLDWVITIGDRARDETPAIGGAPVRLHWDIADPADADGTGREEETFRRTLDAIAARLPALLTRIAAPH
jgi:protein-tyrosine-phosphatase